MFNFYIDPYAFSKFENKSRLISDSIICETVFVLKFGFRKVEVLLLTFDVLSLVNQGLNNLNCIERHYFEIYSLARFCLNKYMHYLSKHEVECRGSHDIVVVEAVFVFKVFAIKEEMLLIDGNSLIFLYLGFHIRNSVAWVHYEINRFSRVDFDENFYV